MNPRSGGGTVTRHGLVERAETLGALAAVTSADQDAAWLARQAVKEGAQVLGVAGGDGTVSAVAAVAVQTGRPLVVVPAGTRNHFARDLGLDCGRPARALDALLDGQLTHIDVGMVNSRVFVNNVSFGVYAEALLAPGYRDAKARTFASIAPGFLEGQQWVPATVDTPEGTIERPQVLLVSNNIYHLSTPRYLGRRFALDTGLLGGIVLKRTSGPPPPDLLPRLRRQLRGHTRAGESGDGVVAWSATAITLHGAGNQVPAGVDGESVLLPLPIRCEARPGALQVLLPASRPGVPREPTPGLRRS